MAASHGRDVAVRARAAAAGSATRVRREPEDSASGRARSGRTEAGSASAACDGRASLHAPMRALLASLLEGIARRWPASSPPLEPPEPFAPLPRLSLPPPAS